MGTFLPFVGMVVAVLAKASGMVAAKAAFSRGINKYVIILYSNILSVLILLPFTFVFHGSRSARPPLTFSILCRFFLLALLGFVMLVCQYTGIEYSSPTLGTAMLNLVPAFTFILAVTFRMEKLDWRSRSSQAKTLGTLVSIAGAFVVTFYKGPKVIKTQSPTVSTHLLLLSPQLKWIIGALLLATQALVLSSIYILQAMVLKMFPAVLTLQFYNAFFGAILSTVYSLIMVEDSSAWKLGLDIGSIAALYSGLVGSFLPWTLMSWCLSKTGPLFVSMFTPLAIIFAVVMGVLFLRDSLYLGSMIGAVIIVAGFYAVMWGKANEEEKSREESGSGTTTLSSEKVPLLQNRIEDKNSSV
ncbi:hypothetical protein SLEP1_g32652 [Rubroshorea leprosula]|uniref:WAT1-related protein n=1 Tax=Rubroshorea leprosula TaxID=152421 RepID=A0AAV5KE14_9ROSI|nr:hypothetical protein SLEP1_g32652 [Rubroshorea leprosula]